MTALLRNNPKLREEVEFDRKQRRFRRAKRAALKEARAKEPYFKFFWKVMPVGSVLSRRPVPV